MSQNENGKSLSGLLGDEPIHAKHEEMQNTAESQVNAFMSGMSARTATTVSPVKEDETKPRATEIVQVSQEEFEQAIPITKEDAEREANARVAKLANAGFAESMKVINAALAEEDRRLEKLDEIGAEAYAAKAHKTATAVDEVKAGTTVNQDDLRRSSGDPEYTIIPDEDFNPEFVEDDIQDNKDIVTSATPDDDENLEDAESITKILAESPYADIPPQPASVISVIRKKHTGAEVVSSGRMESKTLADQAFINSANSFKSKNFRTVRVPLVNSGFFVDMVGTGSNDLIMLYDSTDRRISAADYELNRMKTIMKSVVGAEPRVNPNKIKNMIHHKDYVMMAYGHLCATLDEVVFPNTCPKCYHNFKVKVNPADMLLNAEDLRGKIEAISNASSAAENSLMAADVTLTFDSGFSVTVGHPSYYDEVVMLNALKHYLQTLKPIESTPLAKMVSTLLYIKSITLPNGLHAANIYQTYRALRMMDYSEYEEVIDTVRDITKHIIEPKFGVHDVTCPSCKEKLDEITVDGIPELIFFLTMVTQAEKENTKK